MQKLIILFIVLINASLAIAAPNQMQFFLTAAERQSIATQNHLIPLKFMPGLYIGEMPAQQHQLLLSQFQARVIKIPPSREELDVSAASILLKTPDNASAEISNWWNAGYTGKTAVIGILDSGVPDNYFDDKGNVFTRQKGLEHINIIINRGPLSGFDKYLNGVRTAHGTAVAGVYAEQGANYHGLSYGAANMLVTLAGDSTVDDTNWKLTLINLDWLLTTPNQIKPTVINYSFGNGDIYCPEVSELCDNTEDWSLVAKVVDYIVNHDNISWIKSAGNEGWINPSNNPPFASTMSIPADSYNAIVVANMNNTVYKTPTSLLKTSDRNQHFIRYNSSRGPTLWGRRKPDLTAPGTDIRTSTPTESVYAVAENPTFSPYSPTKQYDPESATRLFTGTSIATPHVGAATALLYDAGIHSTMAIKALLINSADTWTDNGQPGPGDPNNHCTSGLPTCGHGLIMGSQWNRTYGWGYLNMDAAYKQRSYVHTYSIKPHHLLCYSGYLHQGDKVTMVWERRVGLKPDHQFWQLTPLHLALYDQQGQQLLAEDASVIDNVLQVANFPSDSQAVLVKITIPDNIDHIDGATEETFALASSQALTKVACVNTTE